MNSIFSTSRGSKIHCWQFAQHSCPPRSLFRLPSTCLVNSISGDNSWGIKSLFLLKGVVTKRLKQASFPQLHWESDIHAVGKSWPSPSIVAHLSTDVTNKRSTCPLLQTQIMFFNMWTRWGQLGNVRSKCCFKWTSSIVDKLWVVWEHAGFKVVHLCQHRINFSAFKKN